MTREVTNVAASVRQRLLNEAKRRGESFDYVASVYARQRFLARLGASPHRNRLILKGAFVFGLWTDVHRPTRDLDFLGSGAFDSAAARRVVAEICATPLDADDGLTFDAESVTAEPIRSGADYGGVRAHVEAKLDRARIRLQIDIATGDAVTPAATAETLPSLLAGVPPPRVKVYPPETIVAEKLHALVVLGIANSRMKDFFDLYVLAMTREFAEGLLATAVAKTFRRRKTAIQQEPFALTPDFYADGAKQSQWRAFLRKSRVAAPADFKAVGEMLRGFLMPVVSSASAGTDKGRRWRGGQWRR